MACVFEETTRPVEKIPSWWMWHGTMGFRLVDRLLASNIDFLRGNNYHIFVARPDFLQEKRLVLNHGIAQWCLPILQAYHCCGGAAMKDQVLGASFASWWQVVSKCLVLERHCCGAPPAHAQLPGTGNTPSVFVQPTIGVPVLRHMMGYSSTAK
jgi:hypothetical protein